MQFLKDIFNLFYPNLCISCYKNLLKEELFLCTDCRHDLPFVNLKDNEIAFTFLGRVKIEVAISFLYYKKHNVTQKIVHELKYKNNQEIGTFIGNWFGNELKENNFFTNVDYIIPVPLHPKKERLRGYNQLTKFGKALSEQLSIPYKKDILLRISQTQTQTHKTRIERFFNTKTHFFIKDVSLLENKKILLIDDVITTGATLEACCNELLKAENVSINIATIAYTKRN